MLAFLLGLVGSTVGLQPQRLAFFYSKMERASWSWIRQSSSFFRGIHTLPLNLATIPQILLCVSPQNSFFASSQEPISRLVWQTHLGLMTLESIVYGYLLGPALRRWQPWLCHLSSFCLQHLKLQSLLFTSSNANTMRSTLTFLVCI